MNKLTAAFLVASASSLLLVGCADKGTKPQFAEVCEYEAGVLAPDWYCDPESVGGVAAIGEARVNPGNDKNLQRTQAMANARTGIARQLETKVQAMLTDWARTTGAGDAQTYEANFEDTSRQLTQQTLTNTRQLKRWVAPDGTLVLLVGMDASELKAGLKDNIRTSLGNQEALWQQFQSQQALDNLDQQLDKAFN